MRYDVSASLYNRVWAQWWSAINLSHDTTPTKLGLRVNEFFMLMSFSLYHLVVRILSFA